jgi:hypothetical protein
MNEYTEPVAITGNDVDPTRAPRHLSHPQMRDHQENRLVTLLSDRARHRLFVRFDGVWWIGGVDGFTEITSADQNRKLDRWHARLTDGALWE